MTTQKDPTKVITGPCRSTFMFCNKLEQRGKKITAETPKTVKTAILIPKSDKATFAKMKKAMIAALKKKNLPERYAKVSKNCGKDGCCLRDLDYERKEGTLPDSMADCPKNHYFLNATGYKLPGLVDEDNETIDVDDREDRLVSGYIFNFSIKFKGYNNDQDGVSCELINLRFIKEAERLDGGVKAEDENWLESDDDDDDDDDDGEDLEAQIEELEEELEEAEEDDDKSEVRRIKKELRKLKKALKD